MYSNEVPILHHFVRYSEILFENSWYWTTPDPPLFGIHIAGTPLEFWYQKSRVPGLSCDSVCISLCLAVLVQYWLVTDSQTTYRQTDDDSIYCASIVSHGKNLTVESNGRFFENDSIRIDSRVMNQLMTHSNCESECCNLQWKCCQKLPEIVTVIVVIKLCWVLMMFIVLLRLVNRLSGVLLSSWLSLFVVRVSCYTRFARWSVSLGFLPLFVCLFFQIYRISKNRCS